jgi:hypothetical protein
MNDLFVGVYESIPERMRIALMSYVRDRRKPGDFLTAVICNDLRNAVGHADESNLPLLKLYVWWFYNVAPADCHGSREKMNKWLENK